MLGVTLLTAGLVLAIIMNGKKDKDARPEDEDGPSSAAWEMIRHITSKSEDIINGRREWRALFEQNESTILTADLLQKENPERYKRYRAYMHAVMEQADVFQQYSYRLTNEQDEADWVNRNQAMLRVPNETIQLLQRYDQAAGQTTITNQNTKQLVMNVSREQADQMTQSARHNLEGAQNMVIVDNGVRDLAALDTDMSGDPHRTSMAVAQIGRTNTNAFDEGEEGVYLNQKERDAARAKAVSKRSPYNAVPSGKTGSPLNDVANPAMEVDYQPNNRGYVDPKTMLKRAQSLLTAPPAPLQATTMEAGYNRAVVTKQSVSLPAMPFDRERERPQAPAESDAVMMEKAGKLIEAAKRAEQATQAGADSRLGESGQIPSKMPGLVTVQNESVDAGRRAIMPPSIPSVPGGAVVPFPAEERNTGEKRAMADDVYVALQQPRTKQKTDPSMSPARSPAPVTSAEDSDMDDLTGEYENVVDETPEIGDKRTYEGMAGEEMSLRRNRPRMGSE